ncbi:MAG TPA: Hsp20/alpha crystallin family protein [Acidimicrobiales bacterium]|nr:Hsp20/alpha crystallin family protein [Acidimicrobiales bacterium]
MAEERTQQQVKDATAATEASMSAQKVPVNVYETSSAVVIVAPLPAVTAEDVNIELREGTVRFWASLRSAGPREYLIKEWEYGGYDREIDLPAGFGSGVEASLANGQLAIRVLKGDFGGGASIKPQVHPLT